MHAHRPGEVITHFYVASAKLIPEENQQKCLMDLQFFIFIF